MLLPTIGQLERKLSQRIQTLYHDLLGRRPNKIACHFFDEKILITLESSVTKAEQTLANSGQENLAEQVRSDLDEIIQPQLRDVIEEVVRVAVLDLLQDTTLETGRTGIVVFLEQVPEVRNPGAIRKVK